MSERRSPEAQFQLANERTYLAWLRTALALVASGVAAARLLAGQTLVKGALRHAETASSPAGPRRAWRGDSAPRAGELARPGEVEPEATGGRLLWVVSRGHAG
jgi:hypothetical protein